MLSPLPHLDDFESPAQLLRTVTAEKDNKRKRDVIKKAIAYMTLGIDVSRLFSDMVLVRICHFLCRAPLYRSRPQASNTKDIVVKKMVYLFLCNYAASNAELTLLAINTLQKDWCVASLPCLPVSIPKHSLCFILRRISRDEDPMIRGLALRSLCSLRLETILEYVMTPLQNSLTDPSGYVRKTGVLGVLKVFHLAPQRIKDSDLVDTLYNLLRDRDAQVLILLLNRRFFMLPWQSLASTAPQPHLFLVFPSGPAPTGHLIAHTVQRS